jgi:hypothetical protein
MQQALAVILMQALRARKQLTWWARKGPDQWQYHELESHGPFHFSLKLPSMSLFLPHNNACDFQAKFPKMCVAKQIKTWRKQEIGNCVKFEHANL